MPAIGTAHRKLTAFVGNWSGTEKIAASPWAPATTATARCEYRPALDGFAVVQDYRQRRADGGPEFLAHNVFTADPETGETLWYGFDSYGFPPETPGRGDWVGDTLVLEKRTPRGTAVHRLTPDGDVLRHEIDVRMGEAREFSPFLRAHYSRDTETVGPPE
ncbi:DUF1579 family protein [Amycolatopsis samaneae]|uniref:DUF1579 family protein n=1 Tax=Amycolatopsis samaneae TaxID=664691 RepID=A0ABW5GJ42_9PSEU